MVSALTPCGPHRIDCAVHLSSKILTIALDILEFICLGLFCLVEKKVCLVCFEFASSVLML